MKSSLTLLAALSAVTALPNQITFNQVKQSSLIDSLSNGLDMVESVVHHVEQEVSQYAKSKMQKLEYDTAGFEVITSAVLPEYQIRVKESRGLCDPTVKQVSHARDYLIGYTERVTQYSGYLDISDKRHLFFWFFESRGSPAEGKSGASSIAISVDLS